MKKYTRVCAKIDLDAIEENVEEMAKHVSEDTMLMPVLKMDAYGHGAVPIAQMLEFKSCVWGYGTATLEEAIALRNTGIRKPILVLGCVFKDERRAMLDHKVRMTCYSETMAEEVSKLAVKMGRKAYFHVKLDTGMGRLGFQINEESVETILRIAKLPNVVMEGLFTHFAKADETDKGFTEKQLEKYLWMKNRLKEEGLNFKIYHCSNSAALIDVEEARMDMVRAGIALYGIYPSDEVKKENVKLKPAMSLISHIAFVKWVDEGTPISYGSTYITTRRTKVATIPVGYGDGYPRSLSSKGYVLIKGQKAPVIGRVCMDQFMVDVTDIEDVKEMDRVTLFGRDKQEEITIDELGELSGKLHYEFICGLGKRIPRIYLSDGEVTEQIDYFG